MRVRWTDTALRDFESLHSFIASDNKAAADRVVDSILRGLDAIRKFPESGRPGTRVKGTRELVVKPYLVVYRLRNETIEVVAIIHGSRKWP